MAAPSTPPAGRASTRDRIVDAAMTLLMDGGPEQVSTRAVCEAAGVQAPTIYRIFGSKDGLLDAVAAEGFALHQRAYGRPDTTGEPLQVLRDGWDQHVAFGLAQPFLYSVMYGRADASSPSFAAVAANEGLRFSIRRIAEAGLLRVDEAFAAWSITAAGVGTTLTLLATPEQERIVEESARMREIAIAAITVDGHDLDAGAGTAGVVGAASALSALLDGSDALEPAERDLMRVWLDRIARA